MSGNLFCVREMKENVKKLVSGNFILQAIFVSGKSKNTDFFFFFVVESDDESSFKKMKSIPKFLPEFRLVSFKFQK